MLGHAGHGCQLGCTDVRRESAVPLGADTYQCGGCWGGWWSWGGWRSWGSQRPLEPENECENGGEPACHLHGATITVIEARVLVVGIYVWGNMVHEC